LLGHKTKHFDKILLVVIHCNRLYLYHKHLQLKVHLTDHPDSDDVPSEETRTLNQNFDIQLPDAEVEPQDDAKA